ncbi:hypothetical protein JRC49_03200 [Clostridiales bacterium FE2011]|nr:hypothetical protein JRC49_03200 [Clostridiales bacterium FE2011]
MKYTVTYMLEGAVDIEADSEEEARERFEEMDESEKAGNTFCGAWQIDDVRIAH